MTELGDSGRRLAGVDPAVTAAFLDALNAADAQLCAISARLEGMRVHDQAFGKLIDAAKVRDAYHERLPATERNLAEACAVIRHFAGEFTGTGAGAAELAVVEASVEAASQAVRGEHAAASREARLSSEARMSDELQPNADDAGAANATAHSDPGADSALNSAASTSAAPAVVAPEEEAPVVVDADEPAAAAPPEGTQGRPSDGTSSNARSAAPPPAVSAAGAAAAAAAASIIAPRKAVEQ